MTDRHQYDADGSAGTPRGRLGRTRDRLASLMGSRDNIHLTTRGEEKRVEVRGARMTKSEAERVDHAAKKRGMKVSEYLRWLAFRDADRLEERDAPATGSVDVNAR